MKKSRHKTTRNWIAVNAHNRSGAGAHKDKRKDQSRKACRGRVKEC